MSASLLVIANTSLSQNVWDLRTYLPFLVSMPNTNYTDPTVSHSPPRETRDSVHGTVRYSSVLRLGSKRDSERQPSNLFVSFPFETSQERGLHATFDDGCHVSRVSLSALRLTSTSSNVLHVLDSSVLLLWTTICPILEAPSPTSPTLPSEICFLLLLFVEVKRYSGPMS